MTRGRASSIARAQVSMDAHLLDAVAAGSTRRIVYVADTSWYGATGSRPITEDEPPRPSAWGRRLGPALDRLDGYFVAGLPIVTAFPGCVYGNASWFRERVIDPVMARRRVLQFGKTGPWVSPIHVHDGAAPCCTLPSEAKSAAGTSSSTATRSFCTSLPNVRPPREPSAARTPSAEGGDPARGRSRAGRLRARRRGVLEHPAPRDWLPLSVSHARRGIPPNSGDAS